MRKFISHFRFERAGLPATFNRRRFASPPGRARALAFPRRHGFLSLCGAVWLAALTPGVAAESLLLSGATVHTVAGETLAPGQVLIRGGKIAAVGQRSRRRRGPG